MLSARHWTGVRLVVSGTGLVVALVCVRFGLSLGTYEARVVNREVARLSGYWTPAFASSLSVLASVGTVVALAWLVATWIAGRRERAILRAASAIRHRRVLM
jgi:hypothetical protein